MEILRWCFVGEGGSEPWIGMKKEFAMGMVLRELDDSGFGIDIVDFWLRI